MKKKQESGKTTFDFFVSKQTDEIEVKNTQMTPMRIFYPSPKTLRYEITENTLGTRCTNKKHSLS